MANVTPNIVKKSMVDLLATHTFKCALYTSSASFDKDSTVYSATNEVSGTGYTARYEVTKQFASAPIKSGVCVNNGTAIEVKLQTNDLDGATYTLNVFITATVDDFVQVYSETFAIE